MRTKFAILLAIAAVCVTTAWADWTPEVLVTSGDTAERALYPNNGQKVVFGPDGVGHLIWHGGGGIGCNRYDPASGWSLDYQVSPTGENPSIALDADGTIVHAIWRDATLCYRKCVRNESGEDAWGEVVPLPQCGTLWPSMASDPLQSNHLVVCWHDEFTIGRRLRGEAIGFVECIDGVWGAPIRLDSIGGNVRRGPSVSVAPNGDVFIAYFANAATGGCHIFVKTRHDGIWGTTIDATPSLGYDKCEFPAIEVNPSTGNPHVVFNWWRVTQISKKVKDTTDAVLHSFRNSQGAWQTPEQISVPRPGGDSYMRFLGYAPNMAFVSDGRAYAAWCEYSPATSHGNMYSYYSGEGGTWSTPAWLTSDTSASYTDNSPHVAVDEHAQTVHAVWDRLYSGMHWDTEIWWRCSPLGGGSEGGSAKPSAISQPGVELFPNPAKAGRVTVQYALPYAGPMTATLLDVSGRAVRTQKVAADRDGAFSIDVSGLNAGVYVARLVAGDLTVSKSLVVGR